MFLNTVQYSIEKRVNTVLPANFTLNLTKGYHTLTCTFIKIPNSYSDLPVLVIVIILMNVLVDYSNLYKTSFFVMTNSAD